MKVLCVGEMLVDLVVRTVERVTFADDTQQVQTIAVKAGGDANNNAIDMARLGNEVYYVGCIGSDMLGDFLIANARASGVNMDYVMRRSGLEQSKSLILINADGKRTFLQNPGTSNAFCFEDCRLEILDRVDLLQIGGAFHLPAFDGDGSAKLLSRAKEKGIITSMDVTSDRSGRWKGILDPAYPYLDYFLPSIEQAEKIAGTDEPEKIADYFLDRGVRNVVVKLGSQGAFFKNHETAFYTGVYRDLEIVESTGCGDAFCAGFLTGIGTGKRVEDAMILGTACSAFVLQSVGANEGMQELKIVEEFIAAREKPEIRYVCCGKD